MWIWDVDGFLIKVWPVTALSIVAPTQAMRMLDHVGWSIIDLASASAFDSRYCQKHDASTAEDAEHPGRAHKVQITKSEQRR
jgi:hypothetical protein